MERSILFVSETQNFLVTAMIKALKEARFEVSTAEPDMVEISLIQNIPDIYLVYLEGDLNKFNGTLKYLKKLVKVKQEDPTLMTKEEFFARVDEAKAQYDRGEAHVMLPNENLTEYLRRRGYDI